MVYACNYLVPEAGGWGEREVKLANSKQWQMT